MENIYIEESHFGPKWELNPICIRYRPTEEYTNWLDSLVSFETKQQWIWAQGPDVKPNTLISLLKNNIDVPLNVINKVMRNKNMIVLFTEYCDNYELKTYKDLNDANYLDIKIPLMIDDSEFPYINLMQEFMHNNQNKKVLHIDFSDWVHQDHTLAKKIKEYYTKLIGNNLREALNAVDPVTHNGNQNTLYIDSYWNKIVNIINNANHLKDIRIEIMFGSLVRDKYMTNSTPSYNNILLWSEKMKKELTVSEFDITYLHKCYYMSPGGHKSNTFLPAQDTALVCISKSENTFSNIWSNK